MFESTILSPLSERGPADAVLVIHLSKMGFHRYLVIFRYSNKVVLFYTEFQSFQFHRVMKKQSNL